MYKKIEISIDEFIELLHKFSKECYQDKYEKIQYNTWRALNRYTRGTVEIQLFTNGFIQIDIIGEYDSLITSYAFDKSDKTFGSFLWNEMTWDEIEKELECEERGKNSWYEDYSGLLTNKADYMNDANGWYDFDSSTGIAPYGNIDNTKTYLSVDFADYCTKAGFDRLEQKVQDVIDKHSNNSNNNNNDNKENKNMKNFTFDFGPMNGNVVRMSIYGLAVKDKTGSYVSYDAKNGEIINVDIINFDGADFLYKMPVAIKDISIGDIVIHQNVPMFVVDVSKDNKALVAIDPVVGERKEIMLARSPFGFNFATKVVNILGNTFGTAASADNPFGNMWMLLAMNENSDMSAILPMMMLSQGSTTDPTMALVMMAMSQKDSKSDMSSILPMVWMMNNTNPAAPCSCGCHKDA